jgi:hypothetical protein
MSGAIPAVARAGVAGEELGKLPDTKAKQLRGFAGAEAQQGGHSKVGQEAWGGGARRPVVLGGSGRLQCGGRAQEGLKGPIKGEAVDLGVRAPVGIAAVIRAGEADRATARCDPRSGKEASGRRACTGDWPVGLCSSAGWSGATSSEGTAGRNRGNRCEEEEGKEGGGADRRARAVSQRDARCWLGPGQAASLGGRERREKSWHMRALGQGRGRWAGHARRRLGRGERN